MKRKTERKRSKKRKHQLSPNKTNTGTVVFCYVQYPLKKKLRCVIIHTLLLALLCVGCRKNSATQQSNELHPRHFR